MMSFEKDIRKRMKISIAAAIFVAIAIIIAFIVKINLLNESIKSEWFFSLLSFFVGCESPSIYRMIKYSKALKDKDVLEKLYIKENDERNQAIILKTCQSTVNVSMTLLGIFAIIASMFNKTVFYTLGFVLIAIIVLYIFLMVHFSKKM